MNPRAQHIQTVVNDTRALTVIVTEPLVTRLKTCRMRKARIF